MAVIIGKDSNDTLSGTGGDDSIDGLGGDDAINGGFGDDSISGGTGSDTLYGSDGTDVLDGGDDSDHLRTDDAETWADTLLGGAGDDFFSAYRGVSANPPNAVLIDGGSEIDSIDL